MTTQHTSTDHYLVTGWEHFQATVKGYRDVLKAVTDSLWFLDVAIKCFGKSEFHSVNSL